MQPCPQILHVDTFEDAQDRLRAHPSLEHAAILLGPFAILRFRDQPQGLDFSGQLVDLLLVLLTDRGLFGLALLDQRLNLCGGRCTTLVKRRVSREGDVLAALGEARFGLIEQVGVGLLDLVFERRLDHLVGADQRHIAEL